MEKVYRPPAAQRALVTWRSLLLGVLLIPINVYWLTMVEVKYYLLDGFCLPLFKGKPVCLL